jgi:hypothetical protein
MEAASIHHELDEEDLIDRFKGVFVIREIGDKNIRHWF